MTYCGCNSYNQTPKPAGVVANGSAIVAESYVTTNSTITPSGGAVCSGTADVDVVTQVWDEYGARYALTRDYTGVTGEVTDSTVWHLNGTGGGGTSSLCPVQDSGPNCFIAQLLSGRQFITLPSDKLAGTTLTVSCWLNIGEIYFAQRTIYSRGLQTPTTNWQFAFSHSFLHQVMAKVNVIVDDEATSYTCVGQTRLNPGQWYLVAAELTQTSLSVFVNGVLDQTISLPSGFATIVPSNGSFIGEWNNGAFLTGELFDLRISGDVFSAASLAADKASLCDPNFVVGGCYQTPIWSGC